MNEFRGMHYDPDVDLIATSNNWCQVSSETTNLGIQGLVLGEELQLELSKSKLEFSVQLGVLALQRKRWNMSRM
jgi:hypothetical protein